MNSLNRIIVLAILLVAIAYASSAKDQTEWSGYLIDHMCMKAVAQSTDPLDFVRHHTKDCVLMPGCIKEGFVLYQPSKKRWFNLNKKGNELVEKVIRNSKRNSAFLVQVKGKIIKNVLQVEKIIEIETPKKKQLNQNNKSDSINRQKQ